MYTVGMICRLPKPEPVMGSYQCTICRREVVCAGPLPTLYPFCSRRCQMVDLGKWLREEYTIDRDLTAEDPGPDNLPPP